MSEQDSHDAALETGGESTFSQADVDRIVAERLTRERDKFTKKYGDYDDLKSKASRLSELEAASQTEMERAIAKATSETEAKVRQQLLMEHAPKLAKAEFVSAAAGRVEKTTLDGFLKYADMSKFLTETGDADTKAIEAAIKELGADKPADFDGGARTTAQTTDMSSIIRRAAGVG